MIVGKASTREVFIDGQLLSPKRSQKCHNHSPDGFMWGYNGSGPAQLALALMIEFCLNEEEAQKLYQGFKQEIISRLSVDKDFELHENTIMEWIAKQQIYEGD